MEEKRFRDMIDLSTKSNYEIKDILHDIKSNKKHLSKKPSEIKWGGLKKLGNYNVVMYEDYVFVYNEEKVFAIISVYEMNGFEVIPEKYLVVVYGSEDVVFYFVDGFLKKINTRGYN